MTKPIEFVPLSGYEGIYEINQLAIIRRVRNVRGARPGLVLKTQRNRRYASIRIFRENVGRSHMVHTLMANTFLGGVPKGMCVCHNNGIGTDCRLENLRVDTYKNNEADKLKHGTKACGERHGRAKYKLADVLAVRHLLSIGFHSAAVARATGVHRSAVSDIRLGKHWVSI
jgi:HNH endonuclease